MKSRIRPLPNPSASAKLLTEDAAKRPCQYLSACVLKSLVEIECFLHLSSRAERV